MRRLVVRTVVALARLLAAQQPDRIQRVLCRLRRGAHPATRAEAMAARRDTVLTSAFCSGPLGCLPRSIATVPLCRLHGAWPTWPPAATRPTFAAAVRVWQRSGEHLGEGIRARMPWAW